MSENESAAAVKAEDTAAPVARKAPLRRTKRTATSHRKPVARKAIIGTPVPTIEAAKGPTAANRPDRSKPTRVKFADRNRISFDGMDPEYVYRVVNDKDGRIAKMQGIGYEFVESDQQLGDYRVAEGSKMGKAVSKPVGGGVSGYLMRIKKEYYAEDQQAKARVVDGIESSLKPSKAKEEYGPGLTND